MMKLYSSIALAFVLLFSTSVFAQQSKPELSNEYFPSPNTNQHSSILNAVSSVNFSFLESEGYSAGSINNQNGWEAETGEYGAEGLLGPDGRSPIFTTDFAGIGDFSLHPANVPTETNDRIFWAFSPVFDVSAGEGTTIVSGLFRFTATGGSDIRFYGVDDNNEEFAFQIVIDWLGNVDYVDLDLGERVNMGTWAGSDDYQSFEVVFDPANSEITYFLNDEQIGSSSTFGFSEEITSVRLFSDNYHEGETFHMDQVTIAREIGSDPVDLGNFGLLSPADGAVIQAREGNDSLIEVTWEASANAETYTWVATVPGGDLSEPVLALPSDNGGTATTLTLTEGAVYDVLMSLGFEPGNSVILDWGVFAEAGDETLLSEDVFELIIDTVPSTSTGTGETVEGFELSQNYPNPFNPTTNISFTLPETSNVTLEVFNMQGQRVATLVNSTMSQGSHVVTFDAATLSSGIYLYRLNAGSFTATNKMMLVK
ncbi:MAG: T9SS type A sorting domain-containing protein [Balneolales bacterium]|nr:T9SS type A sorting domain-containing protein [Balneolales bacterium]